MRVFFHLIYEYKKGVRSLVCVHYPENMKIKSDGNWEKTRLIIK